MTLAERHISASVADDAAPNDTNCTLRATPAIAPSDLITLRRRMQLEFCKWDSQVGDITSLVPFALLITPSQWRHLASVTEELARETLALESALLGRVDLHRQLALPRRIRKLFRHGHSTPITPTAARVMRFDFHPTPEGWRISEVNSDVPGGFTEASACTSLMQSHFPETTTTGDPAAAYANALARHGKRIALLASPGLIEDHQVIANLGRLLRERGCDPHLAQPRQLTWSSGLAQLATPAGSIAIDAIVRFYQIEWLDALPRRVRWQNLFIGANTPVANPGIAALSESKRLPLLWEALGVRLRAWPQYLPETRDPRDVPWRRDESWLLKSAYCNNGEAVASRQTDEPRQWSAAKLDVLFHPGHWVAQRRFDITCVDTPLGAMRPCIGIYTIDGVAIGIYARLAPRQVIDYRALDVPVLVSDGGVSQ